LIATYDVVVVGGGPAGLSAALLLGRARLRTLVVDAGRPANAVSRGIGGLLGLQDPSAAELRQVGRRQLAAYPTVEVRDGEVVAVEPGFVVVLADGTRVGYRALLLAQGLRYELPALPGLDELWGTSVFHCPFCDGWEVRDRPLAVYRDVRYARLLAGWSDDVLLCTDGATPIAAGMRVRTEPIRALVGTEGRLERIEFESGPPDERAALFFRPRVGQCDPLARELGCEIDEAGPVVADDEGRTSVAGVFVAGDAGAQTRSAAIAAGAGARAAKAIAIDLLLAPTVASTRLAA
jgi:thioredoxin reductase